MKNLTLIEYLEYHFDIVEAISNDMDYDKFSKKIEANFIQFGTGYKYELAKQLTDKFHNLYKDTEWGIELDYSDTMEKFIETELFSE
jgi:hypothetical protein